MKARDGRLVLQSGKISTFVGKTRWKTLFFHSTMLTSIKERGFRAKTAMQSKAKETQHLPPRNAWERYSNYLRVVPRLLKSIESVFGLRLALAAFSSGILAFLENTYKKLIWTSIVILVSTNVASGESKFKLAACALGTLGAMVISYVVWYIASPLGTVHFHRPELTIFGHFSKAVSWPYTPPPTKISIRNNVSKQSLALPPIFDCAL
jgi:hypothetical protein